MDELMKQKDQKIQRY